MNDLADRLEAKAALIEMGEKIAWGSEVALMREAAVALRACKGRDELVALLKEARDDLAAYVRSDWPEDTCEKYPSIATKYDRDMNLCRRIDAALAALEQDPSHE